MKLKWFPRAPALPQLPNLLTRLTSLHERMADVAEREQVLERVRASLRSRNDVVDVKP
jgi:hypothetical protein